MNFELFLGRFHPLVVHLPIGFLLLAAIMEALPIIFKDKFKNLDSAIAIALLMGGFGAVLSAVIGYLLAGGGGYHEQTLFWHKWMGISLGVMSFLGWAFKADIIPLSKVKSRYFVFILVAVVSVTGHLGGNLTHGSDYLLLYAPDFVKKMAGMETQQKVNDIPAYPDSIVVFNHLVQPILENKCMSCHNPTKTQGGLLMTIDGLKKGGETGPAVTPGKAIKSELFKRATLPQNSKKFMPPKGEPLSYTELKLIEWWIESGASFDAKLTKNDRSTELDALLLRDYKIDTRPKPYYERVRVDSVSRKQLTELRLAGWKVSRLSATHRMLDANLDQEVLTLDLLDKLLIAREQLTWLDLSNKSLETGVLKRLGEFTNLTSLKLSRCTFSEEELAGLKDLQHLEVLNLYGTNLSDTSVSALTGIKSLKKIYVWQTKISEEGLIMLQKALPNAQIISDRTVKSS